MRWFLQLFLHQDGSATRKQNVTEIRRMRIYCFMYQILTTPDRLLFYIYGMKMSHRNELMLQKESRIDKLLEARTVMNRKQYHLYAGVEYSFQLWLQTA